METVTVPGHINLKEWYCLEYPEDKLGQELSPSTTMYGVYYTLAEHGDVYEYMGVSDSLVRERIFTKLAETIKEDYEVVYRQWLGADLFQL